MDAEILMKYAEGRKVSINDQIYGRLMGAMNKEDKVKVILKGGVEYEISREDIIKIHNGGEWMDIHHYIRNLKQNGIY